MTIASTSAPPALIDRNKCHTAQAYAEKARMNLRTVYRRIEAREVKTIEISGVTFIYE